MNRLQKLVLSFTLSLLLLPSGNRLSPDLLSHSLSFSSIHARPGSLLIGEGAVTSCCCSCYVSISVLWPPLFHKRKVSAGGVSTCRKKILGDLVAAGCALLPSLSLVSWYIYVCVCMILCMRECQNPSQKLNKGILSGVVSRLPTWTYGGDWTSWLVVCSILFVTKCWVISWPACFSSLKLVMIWGHICACGNVKPHHQKKFENTIYEE